MSTLRVLVIGDTVGKPGRKACQELVPSLREKYNLDLVIDNGENLASGSSLTKETTEEIFNAGVDVITSGDHIFKKREAIQLVNQNPAVLRPLNYPKGAPGSGVYVATTRRGDKIAVVNLIGRVFMQPLECPFRTMEAILPQIQSQTKCIVVDFHAEATSEKVALGWFLDGQISALCGSHTHIQTADERILPNGTAYLTELGMTGPYHSVIGRNIEQVIYKFRTQLPSIMEVATDDIRLSGAVIEIDSQTGKASSIQRIHEKLNGTGS